MNNDVEDDTDDLPQQPAAIGDHKTTAEEQQVPEAERKLVSKIAKIIAADRAHHDKAFDRMREDMFIAKHGRPKTWSKDNYTANIIGRHIRTKAAALYAKNPKAVAKRAERLDFQYWDENPDTLLLAYQTVQEGMAAQAAHMQQQQAIEAGAAAGTVPLEAALVPAPPPAMPPGFDTAQLVLSDFQQGMERRQQLDKLGKTVEILFAKALIEQQPVDFKTSCKQLVKRASTTGVGYVELGFQREYGPRPGMTERLADARVRLDHLHRLLEEQQDGTITADDPEIAELEASLDALAQEPEIVIQEGLTFDFPRSTKVIPDKACTDIVGFIGCRRLTIEYEYTVDEVKEIFKVDLGKNYTGYAIDGRRTTAAAQQDLFEDDDAYDTTPEGRGTGYVRVWKHYDKPSGLVYYIADGHPKFLREPAPPDVFVENFWPVYALTFNAVEDEEEGDKVFPPSDARLLYNMQEEHNRARQGKREHRKAARPRWAYPNGQIEEDDIERLKSAQPFDAIGLDIDPETKIGDLLQVIPVPGVDPNLYDTNENFADMQLTVGAQQAQLGGLAKATATESAISAGASASTDGSSIDDLDLFLTAVARASGQILLREMSEEQVIAKVGPGAFWPHMSLADIAGEVYLEIEAGSTGKPNQAVEINNWKQMLPLLMQIPGIKAMWLAKQTIRRLDDKVDINEAVAEGIPSIVMQNSAKQALPAGADPAAAPEAQAEEGANNGPPPPGKEAGSDPAFGSNQV